MAGVVPDTGELALLNILKENQFNGDLFMRLFINDYLPDADSLFSSFTEATFPGYAAIQVNSWGVPYINAQGKAQMDEIQRVWTVASNFAGETVYGAWYTSASGQLFWAERSPLGPVLLNTAGQTYSVLSSFVGASAA